MQTGTTTLASQSSTTTEQRGASVRWIWPVALALAVFLASSRSQVAAPSWPNIDKVAHALVFGLLATLVARTQPPARYWIGIAAASLYGLFDEIRQSFTPGRSVEVADWVADTLGATVAVALYGMWLSYRRLLEYRLWPRPERQIAFATNGVPDRAP